MRRHSLAAHIATAAMGAVTLAAAASCAASSPPSGAASASPASPAVSASAGSSGPPATVPAGSCDTGAWQSAPVTVTRSVPVPPVPVITAVRTARHPECGYDRLVLDITGPVPGYTIRYVSQVTADPSGHPITVPGQRHLLITLRQAQAHSSAGSATISRHVQVLSSPTLTGWALAGDFEGVVTLAIGLHAATSVRVGELPGRLYIDVKN